MKKKISILLTAIIVAVTLVIPANASGTDKSPDFSQYKKSASSDTSTETTKKAKVVNPLALTTSNISGLYTAKVGQLSVNPIRTGDPDVASFAKLIADMDGTVTKVKMDKAAIVEFENAITGSFLIIRKEGNRHTINISSNGLMQVNNDDYYKIPAETTSKLVDIYKKDRKDSDYVQWLIYMRAANVNKITYQTDPATDPVTVSEENFQNALTNIRGIYVTKGQDYFPRNTRLAPGNDTTKIVFYIGEKGSEDVEYYIFLNGNKMYMETSDLHLGGEYTLPVGLSAKILKEIKG